MSCCIDGVVSQRHAKGSLSPKISRYLGAAPTPSENFMCFDAGFLVSDFFLRGRHLFQKSMRYELMNPKNESGL